MILLRVVNLMFLLGLVACLAGAMAGLIVFAPFVGGAWFLTLLAITGAEPHSLAPNPRTQHEPEPAIESRRLGHRAARPAPARAGRAPA
jgi:hypothetical protein